MLLSEMQPFVRHVVLSKMSAKNENDVFFKLKTPDCRLYFIVGGRGRMIIGENSYEVEAGTVVLFRAGTEYSWNPEPSGCIEYIAVNFDYTDDYSYILRSYHPVHSELFSEDSILQSPRFDDAPELKAPIIIPRFSQSVSQFRTILMEYSMRGELSAPILSARLKLLILSIVRELRQSEARATIGLAARILEYVQENYREQISYDTLGEHFHMSPIYLNRIFKKHLRVSLHEYLLNYRISAAETMLRSSGAGVKEVAHSSGFTDVAHFSKSFKRITGYSPKDYRTAHTSPE